MVRLAGKPGEPRARPVCLPAYPAYPEDHASDRGNRPQRICTVSFGEHVMFAQSAIELAALWLNEGFNLGLIRNNIAFHRKEYQRAAAARIQGFDAFFDRHAVAIRRIRDYRVGWFHHASAGPPRIPIERLTIRSRGFYGVP